MMDKVRIEAVTSAMVSQTLKPGSLIILEGETGSHLFVSAEGQYEVIKDEKVIKTFGPGVVFGELAILYKAKRFASIKGMNIFINTLNVHHRRLTLIINALQ